MVLLAMMISSPISAGFALIGSIVSVFTAIALGVDKEQIYQGIWNESAIQTSIAIGAIFFVPISVKHGFFTIMASFFSTVIHGAVKHFL